MRTGREFRVLACSMLVVALSYAPAAAQQAQAPPKPYEPSVGQEGKDVVWVPTPDALVDKMLDMAAMTPKDFVIDLGSGDGRTVIAAARRGARALGIEYNPDMVELSKRNAAQAGVTDKATFVKADLFQTDLSKATVITMFLLPSINLQLRPKLLELKPGTRIVSNTFTMDDWEADETVTVSSGCSGSWCTALFWVVPAKVAGTWRMPQGDLTLTQQFQKVTGKLGTTPVTGRLRGDEITLEAGPVRYTGRVNGKTIEGTIAGGPGGAFTATRQ
jgi:SAM-dependent methyltransferase